MDKDMKLLYHDILNNELPEVNIPRFFNLLVNDYHILASVRLAMHYYSFYEDYIDEGTSWGKSILDLMQQLNRIIRTDLLDEKNGAGREEAVSFLDRLRNEVMERMKLLTSYVDIFEIHEYVLNRVEYRFKEGTRPEDDEEFAREVLRYIFATGDNVIINDRIREIIGQLPVRMAKQKYFDLLRHSIHGYLGAEEDTLDAYLYMIRTSAMLDFYEDEKSLYHDFKEIKCFLNQLDYKKITREEYMDAECRLKEAAAFLESDISLYYSLQEIINEVYTLLLCSPYKGMEAIRAEKQGIAALAVIRGINDEFIRDTGAEPPAALLDRLTEIEGVQEEFNFDLAMMEEALSHVDVNHRKLAESIMSDKLLNVLLLCRDLLSDSLFIDFYEIKKINVVDEKIADAKAGGLINGLNQFFAEHDRMVNRAVMANTLDKIPVFFKNHTEVMDYVLYSLKQCSDPAEKAACIDLVKDMMSE